MIFHKYVAENGSAAMLTTKRSAGVAPEVNFKEHTSHTPSPSVNKVAHFGFETERIHHKKSKTGVSVALQKDISGKISGKKSQGVPALRLLLGGGGGSNGHIIK